MNLIHIILPICIAQEKIFKGFNGCLCLIYGAFYAFHIFSLDLFWGGVVYVLRIFA